MEYLVKNINMKPDLMVKSGQVEGLTFDRTTDSEVNEVDEEDNSLQVYNENTATDSDAAMIRLSQQTWKKTQPLW